MKINRFINIIKATVIVSMLIVFLLIFLYQKYSVIKYFQNKQISSLQYAEIKTRELDYLVFKNAKDLSDNKTINFDYLSRVLSQDMIDKDNPLIDFLIIDTDNQVYYQFSKTRYFDTSFFSPEQLQYAINSIPKGIDPSSTLLEINNHHIYALRLPYLCFSYLHKYDFVYFFDYSFEKVGITPLLIIIIFIVYGLYFLIRKFIKIYIKQIEQFIDSHTEGDHQTNIKLVFFNPFKSLEEKISNLIAKNIEQEEKMYSVSERFHLLLSQTNDGIYMEDSEGYIYFCNTKLAQILGYSTESVIIGTKLSDHLIDIQSKRVYEQESYFLNISNSVKYKLNITNQAGISKPCIISGKSIFNSKIGVKSYYYAVTDLTDFEVYSKDQNSSAFSDSSLVENSSFPIIIFDQQANVHSLNNAAKNIFSINYETAKGKGVQDIFKNMDIARLLYQFDFKTSFVCDTFESQLNQWFYISNEIFYHNDSMFSYLLFIDISSFRKDESFHNMVFDDLKGFIFITNYKNEVIYVSPSFLYMTQYPASWFINYYKSINDMINKHEFEQIDELVITTPNNDYNFKLVHLESLSKTSKIYVCINEDKKV
ncbi:MAG TPA: PAS domain-containing protein [Candidatus Cloacimonadota bacterium]|nr:PAS domain-containing protein [Candidatus Cloacimonadota bacterium]HQB41146.1 PAS domain-containing protein [Candidatus Cloacimonadota bacterium]